MDSSSPHTALVVLGAVSLISLAAAAATHKQKPEQEHEQERRELERHEHRMCEFSRQRTEELENFEEVMTRLIKVLKKVEEALTSDCYDGIASAGKLIDKDAYVSESGVSKASLKCMVSGTQVHDAVIVAYIIPRSARQAEMVPLGMLRDDIDSIRNTLLLCKDIKRAFERKLISFVPVDNPFSPNRYKLHIWVDSIKSMPIYAGSPLRIGDFADKPLDLVVSGTYTHDPFQRALSYQAYCAFKTYGKKLEHPSSEDSGASVYEAIYKQPSRRVDYRRQLERDIAEEVDDGDF